MGASCGQCTSTPQNSEIITPIATDHTNKENAKPSSFLGVQLPLSKKKTIETEGQTKTQCKVQTKEVKPQSEIASKGEVVVSLGSQTSVDLVDSYLKDLYSKAANQRETSKDTLKTKTNLQSQEKKNLQNDAQQMRSSVSGDRLKFRRDSFVRINNDNVTNRYSFLNKLGEGAYGCVFRCADRMTKQERAIKMIRKKIVKNTDDLFAELDVLRIMDHPNIIKLFEIFDYKDFYYVVTEYCSGGELFEFLQRSSRITEKTVAIIMKQLLSAVNYMHKKNIMHRDLKPQNIMLEFKSLTDSKNGECPPIKIIDFGTSIQFQQGKHLTQRIGSPYYISPDVLGHKYTQKCDLWSCGVIMYTLLSGSPPFKGRTQQQIFANIQNTSPTYECTSIIISERIWPKISHDARDLLKHLLQRNPQKRISAAQALQHKWITNCSSSVHIDQTVLSNLQHFYFKNKFVAVVQTYMALNTISQQDRRILADKFKQIDKDNSGVIEYDQLVEAFKQIYGSTHTEESIKEIILKIDSNGSGKIDFTEFIVAIYQREKLFQHKSLETAFNFFDKDGTGYIEIAELKQLLGNSSEQQVLVVLNSLDTDHDKRISKKQFVEKLLEKKEL